MGAKLKRPPLSKHLALLIPHVNAVRKIDGSVPLPTHLDYLGAIVHLLFIEFEGINKETAAAAMVDVDPSSIHLNPESLRLPDALRLVARLLLVIIESHEKKTADRLKLICNYAAAYEHQRQSSVKQKLKTPRARNISIFGEYKIEELMEGLLADELLDSHDRKSIRGQRTKAAQYIKKHHLPVSSMNWSDAMQQWDIKIKKWNDEMDKLRDRTPERDEKKKEWTDDMQIWDEKIKTWKKKMQPWRDAMQTWLDCNAKELLGSIMIPCPCSYQQAPEAILLDGLTINTKYKRERTLKSIINALLAHLHHSTANNINKITKTFSLR